MIDFPSVEEVAEVLRVANTDVGTPTDQLAEDDRFVDVRLQVFPSGAFHVHTGDSSYDQDHRGHWGASCLPCNGGAFDAAEVARDLLDQAKESYAQSGEAEHDAILKWARSNPRGFGLPCMRITKIAPDGKHFLVVDNSRFSSPVIARGSDWGEVLTALRAAGADIPEIVYP